MDSYPRQRARTRGFRLGAPRSFSITADGQRVIFLRSRGGTDASTCLWVLDLATAVETCLADPAHLLVDAEALPPEERVRRERLREVAAGITDYVLDRDGRVAVFALSGTPYIVPIDASAAPAVIDAPGPVIDPRPDPTGTVCAYVSAQALYVAPLGVGVTRRLVPSDLVPSELVSSELAPSDAVSASDDGQVTWGLADFIAAEEFDRTRGFWWLADGSGLLVERCDASAVERWWIADPAHPEQEPREHRYPSAGSANADLTLWLVRLEDPSITGMPTAVEVAWDHDAFPYLVQVSVPAQGRPLATVLSRDQRTQVILEIDPVSGDISVLRERHDPAWVETAPGTPTRTPDGRLVEVVADHECDTYRLTVDGQPVSPVGLQVEAVIDAGATDVLVVASANPVTPSLHRISYAGEVTQVRGNIAIDDRYRMVHGRRSAGVLLTSTTSLDSTATTIDVWRGDDHLATIESFAETPGITPQVQVFTVGERQLRTGVIFPTVHVAGSQQLPVIMSPYGGPHARMMLAAGLSFGTDQWLADQGYCVIVADGRGTPGRGPAWDRSVRGDLASPALEDQVAALEAVAEMFPRDIDTSRVGIRGWSFGGYLAALAVLRRPDVFHAAVAGAPVTEWRLYDTGYTERYLGLPEEEPANYDRSSLLPLAAKLTRPLLLIHGLADDNVVVAHTLHLSSALLAAGRPHAVLPLTGVTHMTPQEIVAENLLRAEVDFFGEALAAG